MFSLEALVSNPTADVLFLAFHHDFSALLHSLSDLKGGEEGRRASDVDGSMADWGKEIEENNKAEISRVLFVYYAILDKFSVSLIPTLESRFQVPIQKSNECECIDLECNDI